MARTAEVVFVGDAQSLIRASQQAAAATEGATAKIEGANARLGASAETAAARTAKAHDKMIAAAARSNESFAKWGSVAGAGVVAAAIDMGLKVESAAAAISKAGGTSTLAGKEIEDAFRTIPGTVEYSASKIGEAFATVAGELKVVEGHALTSAQAMKVMKAALDLADASGEKLTPTTEALGKVMLTFHLGASKAAEASDVLFNASKVTGTSIGDFTTLVDRARGRLGALAPSLQETAGLMAELAKQGVAGRLTMGALGGAFGTLLSQSSKVTETLKELEVHVFDSKGKFVGLRSVIEQLGPALSKYNEASQLQITRTLFGEKANKQLLEVIHQGVPAYDAATKAVTTHGAAAAAASKEHQTLAGKLRATRADMENLGATVGERLLPILQKLVGGLSDTIKWLDKHQTAAKALAGVITFVLGAAMVDFAVVKVAKVIGGLKAMGGALEAAAVKFGLIPSAAERAAAKTAVAEATLAGEVEAADGSIVAANEAAGASFTAMLGPIAAVVAAVLAAEPLIQKITGGNLGEDKFEAKHGGSNTAAASRQMELDKGGGIMAFFMSKGLSAQAAAGIVGNVKQESGFDPNAPGGGLFQDIGSRAPSGTGSVMHQLEAAWKELLAMPSTLAALKRAKTPAEAARIFSQQFERPGVPMLGNRERAAEEAYKAHPQGLRTLSKGAAGAAQALEALREASEKHRKGVYGAQQYHEPGKAHKARKAKEATEGYIDPFASAAHVTRSRTDQGVDFSFAGPLGALGRGVIEAVKQFQGFGTTIVERLTSGSHKGQRIYYALETGATLRSHGGEQVRAGQQIATGRGSGGVELGFAGPDGLPITRYGPGQSHDIPTAGGKAFSSFLASIGKSGSTVQLASAEYAEALKRASHLLLSPRQLIAVGKNLISAAADHASVLHYGTRAEELGSGTEVNQARFHALIGRDGLSSAAGAHAAMSAAGEVVSSDNAEKRFYEHELKALQKEAKAWARLRDQYKSFARHVHGGAKAEALKKAAGYQAKVETAEKDAKALKGTIYAAETREIEAQTASAAVPGEVQAADLGAYQGALSKVDLEVRAGLKTEAEGKAAKEAIAKKALAGGYGELSPEGILQVKGDLVEFGKALESATNAVQAHDEALKEATKALVEFNRASERLAGLENSTIVKGLADVISGQIGGVAYHGRQMTAGAGSAARY